MRQNDRMNAEPTPPIFTDAYYEAQSFSGIVRRGMKLVGVEFYQCRFDGCQFLEGHFEQCCFEQCTFEKCDLSVIKTLETRFTDVRFLKSKLLGVNWTLAAPPVTPTFHGCNVSHSVFQKMSLPKLVLAECIAREVDFMGTNLTNAQLMRTDFLNTRFMQTNLTGADLSHAVNYAIDPMANRLKKAKFTLPEVLSLLDAFGIVIL